MKCYMIQRASGGDQDGASISKAVGTLHALFDFAMKHRLGVEQNPLHAIELPEAAREARTSGSYGQRRCTPWLRPWLRARTRQPSGLCT